MINYHNDNYSKPDNGNNTASVIKDLLAGSKNLPTLPEINLKLIKACHNGLENIGEIAGLIRMDPALSLKCMDMYYTACQRSPEKLDNLESALNFIGIDAINIMVSCSSAVSIFDGMAGGRNFDLRVFWRHSLKCAILAELISCEIPNQSSDEAYLSGLFHDIGKLILYTSLPNIYGKLLADKTEQGSIILKEKKTIGMDHSYIASKLIDRWQYYPFMADALLYHHYPVEKINLALPPVKILYLANLLATQELSDQIDIAGTARTLFGFDQDKLNEYLLYAETKLDEAAAVFQIENISSGPVHSSNNGRGEAPLNLAREIRDTSLIAYTMQNVLRAKDKESILQILRKGFLILFGKSDVYFFFYDKNEQEFVGHCPKGDDYSSLIDGLRMSALTDNSMLVSCLQNKAPLDSFSYQKETELTLTDYQLIHFAGKEGILCLPMIERDEKVGIIVMGMEQAEHFFISKHMNLLKLFSGQCALALLDVNRNEEVDIKPTQSITAAPEVILSRKIIHEINNPLSVIKNYLKVLGMKLADIDIDHDEIRIINDEINRISKMLTNMSAPPDKKLGPAKEPVNLNALLLDIIKLTNGSLGDGSEIMIHLDNDPSIPEIMTEKDDLKQVFMNLIKNAIEAMPLGGNIGIKTSYINGKKGNEEKSPVNANAKIQISITDDGPGISDEVRSTLFNEFVTSKHGHEGLGLSIVKGIISKLNGSIRCKSAMEKGTSFIIDLPVKAV
jgi:nitrogen-specific signal transduction histidine kinase/HD-like signal output (HDOD) protein